MTVSLDTYVSTTVVFLHAIQTKIAVQVNHAEIIHAKIPVLIIRVGQMQSVPYQINVHRAHANQVWFQVLQLKLVVFVHRL